MIKSKKSINVITLVAILTLSTWSMAGCSSKESSTQDVIRVGDGATDESKNKVKKNEEEVIKKSEKYNLKLQVEKFSLPGVFTMEKPAGWKVYKAGDYNTLAFLTRDENEPLRQAFTFAEVGIFYVDGRQKDTEVYYQKNGGYAIPWIDMPVVSPFNGTNFLKNYYSIMNSQIGKNFRAAGNMPIPSGFQKIEILSEQQISPLISGVSTVLVRAILYENNKVAQGMFTLSTYKDAFGHGTAFLFAGVTAPVNEYISVKDTLLQSINSFKMEEAYVSAGMRTIQENGEVFRQISQTISETSDIITKGWNERNKGHDVSVAKKSDQIMGVERVYDADLDEVYEVENGFYDYYQTHQDQYKQKNLQPLPNTNYDLWDKAPIINHSLVLPK